MLEMKNCLIFLCLVLGTFADQVAMLQDFVYTCTCRYIALLTCLSLKLTSIGYSIEAI